MNAATKEKSAAKAQESLQAGEWVWYYPHCKTDRSPAPAIVCKDANTMNVACLTVFFEAGPLPMRSVMDCTDEKLKENHDLRRNGCWSRERIDGDHAKG